MMHKVSIGDAPMRGFCEVVDELISKFKPHLADPNILRGLLYADGLAAASNELEDPYIRDCVTERVVMDFREADAEQNEFIETLVSAMINARNAYMGGD